MTGASIIPRRLIILVITLPVAALLGLLLATPLDLRTIGTVGLVLGLISVPLILRWHRLVLVFSWNATISFAFLPGQPALWMLMSLGSLALVLAGAGLDRTVKLIFVPSLAWTILAIVAVTLITAELTGGMGVRALGGAVYGGKRYYYIVLAAIGFFALSVQRIPLENANQYSGLFVLSRLTSVVSNLLYFVPALWYLYFIFPVGYAENQAMEDMRGVVVQSTTTGRFSGVGFGMASCVYYMLLRFGVRGHFDLTKPWRLPLLLLFVALSLLGGFRAILLSEVLVFLVLFTLERLWRTRWAVGLALAAAVGLALLSVLATQLPMSVQRSLSILPIKVDPVARVDAQESSVWRLNMWKTLLPEIPYYLWLGKGYTANATDYFLVQESVRRGFSRDYEAAMVAGNYHSGPLSVIIPFGVWGVLAFSAFLLAAWRALLANYRYGLPQLAMINRYLLAAFVADLIFFTFIFGDLSTDLPRFVGYAGLSVSLNGGVRRELPADEPAEEVETGRRLRRAWGART
jgi:hypothetical protein